MLQRVVSFSKRFKSESCLQIRAKNICYESALQVGVASWPVWHHLTFPVLIFPDISPPKLTVVKRAISREDLPATKRRCRKGATKRQGQLRYSAFQGRCPPVIHPHLKAELEWHTAWSVCQTTVVCRVGLTTKSKGAHGWKQDMIEACFHNEYFSLVAAENVCKFCNCKKVGAPNTSHPEWSALYPYNYTKLHCTSENWWFSHPS